eukprot:GHUV01019508.1.p1 GENE.GHUV01019508.1~~GHUV01019508.1.p1  ORF type:complete len:156 (-),score=22.34 GHUV01019508.1:1218-1685(-)
MCPTAHKWWPCRRTSHTSGTSAPLVHALRGSEQASAIDAHHHMTCMTSHQVAGRNLPYSPCNLPPRFPSSDGPQDGTVGCDIKLTGILSTSLLSPDEKQPSHGTLVGAGVNAAHHQHLFSARLDLVVDDEQGGKDLVVCEVCVCCLLAAVSLLVT